MNCFRELTDCIVFQITSHCRSLRKSAMWSQALIVWFTHAVKWQKNKGKFLCSAESSPQDCSNRFTLHSLCCNTLQSVLWHFTVSVVTLYSQCCDTLQSVSWHFTVSVDTLQSVLWHFTVSVVTLYSQCRDTLQSVLWHFTVSVVTCNIVSSPASHT